jgi:hypothetical protein
MTYGIMFWGMGSGSNRVFILQKRAIRTLNAMNARDSCRQKFKEQNILTMPCAFALECLLYAHNNMKLSPLNSDYHDYDTRKKDLIRPPEHRLAKVSKSFICISVRLYNILPPNLKSLNTPSFKREVKKYLVGNAYYSVDEMLKH